MRSFLLFSFFIGIFLNAVPQSSIIEGFVSDKRNGRPIQGAHIIHSTGGVLSDEEGKFSFTVTPGKQNISISYIGYETIIRNLTVSEGKTLSINISLESQVTSINEIVITAGKSEQRLSDLTVSMSLLKPYQISRNHILNAEEMLLKTSGVEITDGQASIRGGSGYSYGAGSRVLTLIDGLPALSADAGNVKWGTLPIENISRIEVIKGASSVLYGSSALNGVINFISRDAETEPITRVTLTGGVYDKPSRIAWLWWDSPRTVQNLAFNHTEQYGNTQIGIGARVMNDDGYRMRNYERNARVSFKLKSSSKKNANLKYGASFYGSYTSKNDFLLWENATTGGLIQSESSAMDYLGTSLALDPFITIPGKGSGNHKITSRIMTNLNRLPDNENNNSDSHSAYLEYQYSNLLGKNTNLVSGISQQYSYIASNFYGDHNGYNIAAYAQTDIELLKNLKGVAGVRLEQYLLDGVADRPVPIFRAGLNYEIGPNTFVRGSFGQGYRYPSIAEKHAYTTVGAVRIFPNPEIGSEKGWSAELGIKQGVNADLTSGNIDMSVFYSRNKDMIEYVFGSYPDPITDIPDLGFRPVNIENSVVYGIETNISLARNFGMLNSSFRANYTYLYPVEIRTAASIQTEFLKYRRKHSGSILLLFRYKKFNTGIGAYAKSKLLRIDDVFVNELSRETILPGFFDYWTDNNNPFITIDINIGYGIPGSFDISIVAKNITNVEYIGRPGDIQPHRYFSIQVSKTFSRIAN